MWAPPPPQILAAALILATGPDSANTGILIGQIGSAAVALIAAFAALRSKKTDSRVEGDKVLDQQRARIEAARDAEIGRKDTEIARLDRELGEAYAEVGKLRGENHEQWRLLLRYERLLHLHGIDPGSDDGGGQM